MTIKRRIIFALLIIGFILCIPKMIHIYEVKKADSQVKLNNELDQKLNADSPEKQGFGKYLKASRVGYRSVFEQDQNIPKECLDYFDALQKIDFLSGKQQTDQLTYQLLPVQPENCQGEFVKGFTAAQEDFLKKCKPKDKNLSDVISDECSSSVFMLRAAVTRIAVKDKSLNEITDMVQLADLVFSEFSTVFNSENPNFSQMQAIAQRMLDLDPKLFAAQKVNVIASLMQGFTAPKDEDQKIVWDRAEKALIQAQAVKPNDEMLQDAQIAISTHGFDPSLTHDLSEKMTQDNPNNDRGWFLMAYSNWKQGDHPSSINNLKHAIALAPQNQDYQKIMSKVILPNANGESFQSVFKIGISNDDFNH